MYYNNIIYLYKYSYIELQQCSYNELQNNILEIHFSSNGFQTTTCTCVAQNKH